MAYKIVVDSGHGGEDPGAVSQGRQEKDDTLQLGLEVGNILKNNGVDVIFTRTEDIYQTPFQKAQIANEAMADYFVSIHRNSSPRPNQYEGVETLVYDKSGIKLEMAENIDGALEEVGFKNLGVKERPGLVVLRRTKMPALLVEAGFINSEKDNQLFDEKFREIAQAIAGGILGTLSDETVTDPILYRVQVGTFRKRQNADNLNYKLLSQGYPSFLLKDGEYYRVQVGAFQQMGNAVAMEQKLRKDGYQTLITTR
ncbi:MAG: N-acetylmuramoyl-L-alanine amidase [Oliverpabstia sp.]|nr:N-acetylmuramoyl-L-alanine amidase [Oliverpabstia sp.]